MSKDVNRRWTSGWLDENEYNALCELGMLLGTRPAGLVKEAVGDFLEKYAGEEDASPELRAFAMARRAKKQEEFRTHLVQAAWSYLSREDESLGEELKTLCGDADLDFEEVLNCASGFRGFDVGTMPFTGVSDTVASATRWLRELLADGECPTTRIVELGKTQGYSKSILKEAKGHIGAIARRRPKWWVWRLPDLGEKEDEEEGEE